MKEKSSGVWITNTQYKALLELYNNCNEAFTALPQGWQSQFFKVLYRK